MKKSDTVRHAKRIIAVGGGKGGVGKSILSIALSVGLARRGQNVVIADLDLGAANLHTYMGIFQKTPSLADFILSKKSSLDSIMVDTSVKNLRLISGSQFVPGMANPAHWTKIKLMRHLQAIEADTLIIDLGAGVHFNTLDFFGLSDRGIVVTMPEPGAVMNAYSFLKGALFRKLQNVFKRHPKIGPLIDEKSKRDNEGDFTFEWLCKQVQDIAPETAPLIHEVSENFRPYLIINKMSDSHSSVLVRNLLHLCKNKLGIEIEHIGDLPDVPEIVNYLLRIPDFLSAPSGKSYAAAIEDILNRMDKIQFVDNSTTSVQISSQNLRHDFTDEELEEFAKLLDSLNEKVFEGTNRQVWKLRIFFKPLDVIRFLVKHGVEHPIFYA